jgi:hypothetical protein
MEYAFQRISQQNLQWEMGRDELVEVNQRALIEKILARYSGEFTGEIPLTQAALDLTSCSLSRTPAELR